MLNFKNRIFKLLLGCVIFSMVIISGAVYAKDLTIDLNGLGRSLDDISNREIVIWKVDSKIYSPDERTKLADSLNGFTAAELDKRFGGSTTIFTNNSGTALHNFDQGTYYARVTDVDGKIKIYPFVFVSDDKDDDKTILPKGHHETPPGDVELLKVSADSVPLGGAEFLLYKVVNGEEIPVKVNGSYKLVTDSNGLIHVGKIEMGEYVFKEIKAPDGYRIKVEKTYFVVNPSGTTRVVVVNYKDTDGGKRFKKIDSVTGNPIEGVQFVVSRRIDGYDDRIKVNGKDLVLVSDKDGYFVVDNLPFGDYFIWEVKPQAGYEPLGEMVSFVIDTKSLEKDIVIKNKPVNPPPEDEKPKKPPKDKEKPKKPRRIPKTGDVSLILMSIFGVILSVWGGVLVKENK